MWLFVEPLDVLLFRDSKPFTRGESHRAKSLWPLSPYTLVGALRSKILSEELPKRGCDFQAYAQAKAGHSQLDDLITKIGSFEDYGKIGLKGPFLCHNTEGRLRLYFPVPRDLFRREGIGGPGTAVSGNGSEEPDIATIDPLSPNDRIPGLIYSPPFQSLEENGSTAMSHEGLLSPLWLKEPVALSEPDSTMLLDENRLPLYLRGAPAGDPIPGETLYETETRTGIKLDRAPRAAEEGMLYMAEFLRFRHKDDIYISGTSKRWVGLAVDIVLDDELLPASGLLALGGESRAARFEKINESPGGLIQKETIQKAINYDDKTRSCRFKLYLAAPAIFKQGWLPDFIDPQTFQVRTGASLTSQPVKIRLVTATVGKAISIGGWDLAKGAPKPMYKAAPAGSVYYFEMAADDKSQAEAAINDIFNTFHYACHLQSLGKSTGDGADRRLAELAKIGFGLSFVGTWNYA